VEEGVQAEGEQFDFQPRPLPQRAERREENSDVGDSGMPGGVGGGEARVGQFLPCRDEGSRIGVPCITNDCDSFRAREDVRSHLAFARINAVLGIDFRVQFWGLEHIDGKQHAALCLSRRG
jgi:hypothetical protein